jgi:hypothetical protein
MTEQNLRTFLEYAVASIDTVVVGLIDLPPEFREDGSRFADCYCELEQAVASIKRARKCLRATV